MNKKLFTKELKIGSRLYCSVYENGFEETINIVVFRLKQRLWLLQDDESEEYFESTEEVLNFIRNQYNGISSWWLIES